MTVAESIKAATETLHTFDRQAEDAGGIEQIIAKLVRITQGEEGVTLTAHEAAACSHAIGTCVYLANASLIYKHGSPPTTSAAYYAGSAGADCASARII